MAKRDRRSIFGLLLRALAIAGLVLAVAIALAAWLGVTVSLDRFRPQAERAASRALGRPVHLDGHLAGAVGFTGGLLVERLRVANPEGWDGDLLRLEHAHVKLSLLALLRHELHLRELVAQDALLALEERADGSANWLPAPRSGAPADRGSMPEEASGGGLSLAGFDRVSLERLEVTLVRPEHPHSSFGLESFAASGPPGEPVHMEARGHLGAEAFSLQVATDSIRAGRDPTRPFSVSIDLDIAHTRVGLDGSFGFEAEETESSGGRVLVLPGGRRAPDLRLHVEGRRLDDLDRLADMDLPPLGPFEVDGRFRLTAAGFDVSDARLRLGSSTLSGRTHYVGGARPVLEARLESPLVQLDDFRAKGWSAFASERSRAEPEPIAATGGDPAPESDTDEASPPPPLVSLESLRRGDGRLEVVVAEVRSGKDVLGHGRLLVTAEDGRARIEVELAIPGGSFEMALGAEPAGDRLDTSLVMRSDRIDYGVLARRIDPEAKAEGWLSLNVDIRSRTRGLREMLAGADGAVAFAVFPENLDAAVFDLWAANLLLAVLPRFGEAPTLNCAAARMQIEGGHMTQRELLIDTSTVRVGGHVDVDFKERTVEAVFAPVAKVPRMFSAATPVRVHGTFEDFGVGVRAGDVVLTVARMAASPLVAPLKRIVGGTLERDGSDLCEAAVNAP